MREISVITGTLNRLHFLPAIIENTVNSSPNIELVLIDGGSSDGTQKWIKELNHPQIKFIEVGQRSSYPHFMNLAIETASHDFICQWNDDVILLNDWDDVFDSLDDSKVYPFAWTHIRFDPMIVHTTRNQYVDADLRWMLYDERGLITDEFCLNYGIYHRSVFEEIGMYDTDWEFFFADGEMSHRAWKFGLKIKMCPNIRVASCTQVGEKHHYNPSGKRMTGPYYTKLYKIKKIENSDRVRRSSCPLLARRDVTNE